jgi:hypothetical protein
MFLLENDRPERSKTDIFSTDLVIVAPKRKMRVFLFLEGVRTSIFRQEEENA